MENIKQKIFDYIDSQREEMIATLSDLISYPSVKGEPAPGAPFGVPAAKCLERALEICSGFGFTTRNFEGYVGTAAYTEGEPELGILAHLDVVPEGTGWTGEPYKARIADGRLYGRGAIDDKGPAVAVIYAMKALKELNIPLKKGFKLILGTDEENGSADLEYYFKQEKPPKYSFTPDGNYPVINIEKGMIRASFGAKTAQPFSARALMELSGGTVVNAVPQSAYAVLGGVSVSEIEAAVKRINLPVKFSTKDFGGCANASMSSCVRIDCEGRSAHASTPEIGANAITALIRLIRELNLTDDASRRIAKLSELFPFGETDGESLNINMSDPESGALTCVLSIINFEAGELSCAIDIRLPASYTVADVTSKLLPALEGADFKVEKCGGAEPHKVSADSPFVKKLLEVYEDVTGEKGECIAIGGGTYVHEIEGGVAFGAEFLGEDNHMHSPDEFIELEQLALDAKMFALAIAKICG